MLREGGNMEQSDWDFKNDMIALSVALSAAFWIGFLFGEGTLGMAMVTGLSLYIGIRFVQIWPHRKD